MKKRGADVECERQGKLTDTVCMTVGNEWWEISGETFRMMGGPKLSPRESVDLCIVLLEEPTMTEPEGGRPRTVEQMLGRRVRLLDRLRGSDGRLFRRNMICRVVGHWRGLLRLESAAGHTITRVHPDHLEFLP